jgi:type I restriction enzyme, S subunit
VQQLVFDAAQNKRLPHKLKPRPQYQAEVGDILVTRAGPKNRVGISCVVDVPCPRLMISDKLIRFHPLGEISSRYIALALNAGRTLREIEHAKSGMAVMQMNISQDKLRSVVIPVPPVAEQHRIIAKVDELMALCDQLEKARADRETGRDKLTAATLARLNTPNPETFRNDARFALDNLQSLTTRPDQIKQLKQTICNLAVRGRLSRQDPRDEPARLLLERLPSNKGSKKSLAIEPEHLSFPMPAGWAVTRLGRLVLDSDAGWSPKTANHPRSGNNWGVLKVSAVSWDKFLPEENKELLKGTEPRQQARVRKGDFLISRANTAELISRAVVVDVEPVNLMMSDKIVRLSLVQECDPRYLLLVNNHADFSRSYYAAEASGVSPSMKNVSRDVILSAPVPLPPLAEQHRIVAKVDELISACDALELALSHSDSVRGRLLAAAIAESLNHTEGLKESAQAEASPAQTLTARRRAS